MASRTTDGVAATAADAVAVAVANAAAAGCSVDALQLVSSRRHSSSPFVVSTLVEFGCVAAGRMESWVGVGGVWWTCWSRICDGD